MAGWLLVQHVTQLQPAMSSNEWRVLAALDVQPTWRCVGGTGVACWPVGDADEPDTPGVGDAGKVGEPKAAAPVIRGLKAPVLAACCCREPGCTGDCPGLWLKRGVAAWGAAASVLDACTKGTAVVWSCAAGSGSHALTEAALHRPGWLRIAGSLAAAEACSVCEGAPVCAAGHEACRSQLPPFAAFA